MRPSDILSFPLLSDDLDDDSFGALPIEFTVEEARPAAKVDPAIGDGARGFCGYKGQTFLDSAFTNDAWGARW